MLFIKSYASGGSGSGSRKLSDSNPPPQSIPARNRRGTPAVFNPPVNRRSTSPMTQYYINRFAGRGRGR